MSEYTVCIKGETLPDDGLEVTLPGVGWEYAQQGECPDCGGTWVLYAAGYVPGTRKCLGRPIDPPHTLLDRRVPQPTEYDEYGVDDATREIVSELYTRRNTCPDDEIERIDATILRELGPHCRPPLKYDDGGGCGSFFSVGGNSERWYIRRERFY